MTETEIDERIYEAHRNGENVWWSPEDFHALAHTASTRGWGMQFMGVQHFIDVPKDNSSHQDTEP